jgi:hypothetical protein
MKARRRWTMPRHRGGCCQDCGNLRPVTTITFWATGYEYRVCGECIEAYRAVILKP